MVSISAFQYVISGLEEMKGVWQGEKRITQTLQPPRELKFDLDSVLRKEIARVAQEAEAVVSFIFSNYKSTIYKTKIHQYSVN